MKKILLITTILIGFSSHLFAYKAKCIVVWDDSPTDKQIFNIEVSNGILTRYTNHGTFTSTYRGMYLGDYVYVNGEATEYLGKFINGKFSFSSDIGNGDGLTGTCTLK